MIMVRDHDEHEHYGIMTSGSLLIMGIMKLKQNKDGEFDREWRRLAGVDTTDGGHDARSCDG